MYVLALDLGRLTGWSAEWYSGSGHDWIELGDKESCEGERYETLWHFLNDWDIAKVGTIVCERPHHVGGAATRQTLGYRAITILWAKLSKIRFFEVHSGTLKKHATGHGRCGKNEMLEAAEKYTCEHIDDHNEADAICIMHWAMDQDWALEEEIVV